MINNLPNMPRSFNSTGNYAFPNIGFANQNYPRIAYPGAGNANAGGYSVPNAYAAYPKPGISRQVPNGYGFQNVNPFIGKQALPTAGNVPMTINTSTPDISQLLAQLMGSKDNQDVKIGTANQVDGKSSARSLGGKGSIEGTRFRSAEGESYSLQLTAGRSYNLLSDAGVALNGAYKSVNGTTVLGSIGLAVGRDIVTFADDGTLRINGEAYSARKNNLNGNIKKDGTSWVINAGGYEFKLRGNTSSGVKVDINAKSPSSPEGLWGASLDGVKQKAADIQADLNESDYRVDDMLDFSQLSGKAKGKADLTEAERNDLIWKTQNPVMSGAVLAIDSLLTGEGFVIRGPDGVNQLQWIASNLRTGTFYNLFSDEGIQVNGKFGANQKLTELGIVFDGEKIQVKFENGVARIFDENGTEIKSNFAGLDYAKRELTVKGSNGESWLIAFGPDSEKLKLRVHGTNVGANSTRSSGLLGDGLGANFAGDKDSTNVSDIDGAGYIRDADGKLSRTGQSMVDALAEYEVSDALDTAGGRSVYR